jgi:methionyl aminopeptidase
MINIKSTREIELMRHAGHIVAKAHQLIRAHVRPGVTTKELDQLVQQLIEQEGATPSFLGYRGYPASICASVNEEVVHGIPSDRRLVEGDILSVDIGVQYLGYHGDSAWTYAVGSIAPKHQKLLDVTEQALYVALEAAKVGGHVGQIGAAIEAFIQPYGYGIVEEFTGHGVGRELHEEPPVPNFGDPTEGPILKPGMTLAIEPMINLGTKRVKILKDGWTAITADRQISAHFEHTVVLTESGYDILTTTKKENADGKG